jgi:thiamine transport system permease protein
LSHAIAKKSGLRDGSLLIASGFVLYLVSPYLLIFRFVGLSFAGKFDEFLWALKNSFNQAFFSAFGAVCLGFLGAVALVSCTNGSRIRRSLEVLFVLPGFLPPIFLIIALFSTGSSYPVGLLGIVIAHTISCFGLTAYVFARQIETKLMHFSETASVLGAGRWLFLNRVALPILLVDFARAFFMVFLMSIGSFSIPLVMGGGLTTTLEILIYEKIRNSGDWGQAVAYSIAQSAIILFLVWAGSVLFPTKDAAYRVAGNRVGGEIFGRMRLLRSPILGWLLAAGSCYLLVCYGNSVVSGFVHWGAFKALLQDSWQPLLMTCFFSLSVGIALVLVFLAIIYCLPMPFFEKFLNSYLAPSTALSSFAFLTIGSGGEILSSYVAVSVIVLIYLAAVFRLGISSRLRELTPQIHLAETLGAGRGLIYRKIILPQILGMVFFSSGIGAVWASGDFAVTRLFTVGNATLALMVQSLAASYRLDLAGALSAVLLGVSAIIFLLFLGACYVVDKKSQA